MRKLLQSAAVASAGLLIVSTGAANAAPAPTTAAGTWLKHQFTGGVVHNTAYDVDDYGLTADTALALKQLGASKAKLKTTRKALAAHVNDWVRGGTTSDLYAGSVAKAAVTADALGANPKKFGGDNLVKLLKSTVSTSGATKGRIRDTSAYGDYANTLGQALAAQALSTDAPTKAKPVVTYLLKQQCSSGYFRLYFADPSAPQTCDAGDPKTTSVPDPDATSAALLSLEALPHQTAKVKKAERKAARWLRKQQAGNGSFIGGTTTATPNANSTGLAASALAAAGDCRQARKAATWVAKLQVSKKRAKGALSSASGAIAYDKAALSAATTAGITSDTQDQWRRATTQAAPALRYLDSGSCA
ncbi:hypothetical protein P5P86_07165 [Nocardioides sp. BP30]|uniref:hypothetical protein n=1 Tax=Nocardioides sp. BP30 TaxID=3036374 RepID=UPI002468CBA8|nr:hypothetical protein [Nocardioides sp. BP30]WGL53604.1 hypothetical protein P5P86_07165 [Nocardioides sp. BP30]